MCVPIQWVTRDGKGNITHVGGSSPRGVVWGLSTAEATSLIKQREWDFFVEVAGKQAPVVVANRGGSGELGTIRDDVTVNNLDNLPMNPQPLAGVLPGFPLSLPGWGAMGLMRLQSVKYAAGGQLRPLISQVTNAGSGSIRLEPAASLWTQSPRWLYLDVIVPFPCEVVVVAGVSSLTKVPGDSPSARRALEAAGKGWWSMEYVLTRPDGTIDPTGATRITEARIIVRPSDNDWALGWAYVGVFCHSLNPHCPSQNGTSFRLKKPAVPMQPATSMVEVPNIISQQLDLALSTLWALKFKVTFVGPTDVSTNLRVKSQDLAAGTRVREGLGILLSTEVITAATGFKAIVITNQYDRAMPLDVWLFDHSNGSWSKETTIAYQATGEVSLGDGHVYSLYAVDDTKPGCNTGRADEDDCIYATSARTFDGDDNGLTFTWTITSSAHGLGSGSPENNTVFRQ